MESFKTQFLMSDVPTDVTVKVVNDSTYSCTLNLVDFFDGGELEGTEQDFDVTLIQTDGQWQLKGESKIVLTDQDVQNLGQAIQNDYISRHE